VRTASYQLRHLSKKEKLSMKHLLHHRVVREDLLTSVHVEEYSLEVRETKRGMEELTSDINLRQQCFVSQLRATIFDNT